MEIRLLTLFTDPVVPRNHPSLSYSDSGTEPKIRQDLCKVRVFQESNPHRTFVNAQVCYLASSRVRPTKVRTNETGNVHSSKSYLKASNTGILHPNQNAGRKVDLHVLNVSEISLSCQRTQETKVGERRRKGAALSPSVLHGSDIDP
ncbi:uncharacterized protein FOMMEDRAFT_154370 [Fomitiporia mediterranea MF3/22]|uniref:uncharacterized protein n=1 Tax=Fomitiporia mediterranea (strain MF3/22) TaxID=694068 RepID=UPI00044082F9|nr:uncharacterized protein FOMMEDRAFT_154370 [Fomitiporia mediterranea MF3/22]EJD05165.1 hypothetical protein FOMMEDRAFT_154370 [Fomitiporia mediterranea MF3/22]